LRASQRLWGGKAAQGHFAQQSKPISPFAFDRPQPTRKMMPRKGKNNNQTIMNAEKGGPK
jgi:hypothetical protein